MSPPTSTDLLIVGGGIIGLSVAWEGCRRGHRVTLLERRRVGGGATRVAAGMLGAASEVESTAPALTELAVDSVRRYPEFVRRVEEDAGREAGYDDTGTLLVALDRDHLEELEHGAGERRRLGLACRELSARDVRRREPRVSPRVVGGFLAPDDVQVDPRRLAAALAAAIRARGGRILEGSELVALEPGDPCRARVRPTATREGDEELEIEARRLVAAAGVWTTEAIPGIDPLPLRPVKGQLLRLRGDPGARHVLRTPDVYLVPRREKEIVVGATMEEQGFDEATTAGAVMDLLVEGRRALPTIYEMELRETNVGFRPALRDHLPAIGPTSLPGVWVATGHYRNGILLAPSTATLLVDAMEEGTLIPDLEAFDPLRFAGTEAGSDPHA